MHGLIPSLLLIWQIGFPPPPSHYLAVTYLYIHLPATKFSSNVITSKEKPYAWFKFLNINLKKKFIL
ncbi:L1 family major capsid protein, partial [Haemophilus influenzae]